MKNMTFIKKLDYLFFPNQRAKRSKLKFYNEVLETNEVKSHILNSGEFLQSLMNREYDYFSLFTDSSGFLYVDSVKETRIWIRKIWNRYELEVFTEQNERIALLSICVEEKLTKKLDYFAWKKNGQFVEEKDVSAEVDLIQSIWDTFEKVSVQIDRDIQSYRPCDILEEEKKEYRMEKIARSRMLRHESSKGMHQLIY